MPKGVSNNPAGRTKGSLNERTDQWNALAASLAGCHAEAFNEIMGKLAQRAIEEQDDDAADLFLTNYNRVMNYFKPKQASVTHAGDKDAPPIQIVVSGETWGKL